MPDHVHLLLESSRKDSNFKKFTSMFKQKSGYAYKKMMSKKLWQENYYKHVLRDNEGAKEVLRYILNNPVQAGLVDNYYDYLRSGSFAIKDIKDLS